MAQLPEKPRARLIKDRVTVVGLEKKLFDDLYHLLLTISWLRLMLLLVALYVMVNMLFAVGYLLDRGGLENAREGSYLDCFFFSVQTMATIGYGKMVPQTVFSNSLVTIEALVGMLSMAMATGLMFAKFSRPTARVLFSEKLVVHRRDGVPSLVLRMANQRGNQVVEASVRLSILRDEVTREGERVRRMSDLKLVRSQTAVFALSWTAIHIIDESSPFFGLTEADVHKSTMEVMVSLIGTDETFSQTVHARHNYFADEIVFGQRFADVLLRQPDGRVILDYSKFHDLLPAEAPL